jgi:hypothetical protein
MMMMMMTGKGLTHCKIASFSVVCVFDCKVKVKCKIHPRKGHEGPKRE